MKNLRYGKGKYKTRLPMAASQTAVLKINAASRCDLGERIAISYLPAITVPATLMMETNKARLPNSAGLYSRVSTGETNTGTACAIMVPDISTKIFLVCW